MSATWAEMQSNTAIKENAIMNIARDPELNSLLSENNIPAIKQVEPHMEAITNILNGNQDIIKFCYDVVMNIYESNKSYFDTNATVITDEMICLYIKALIARILVLNTVLENNLINFEVRSLYAIHYNTHLVWLMNETSIEMQDKNSYSGNHIQLRLGLGDKGWGYDIEIAPKDIWKMDLTGPQEIALIKKNIENYSVQYDIDFLDNSFRTSKHVEIDYCLVKDLVKTIKKKIIEDFPTRY